MKKVSRFNWIMIGMLVVTLFLSFSAISYAETDVTDKVQLIKSRLRYDRRAGTSYLDVSLQNISQDVLLTPIKVIIESISDPTITVANADGTTDNGKSFFEYSTDSDILSPDQSTDSKRWTFSNPNRRRFSYEVKILESNVGTVTPVTEEEILTDIDTGIEYVAGQVLLVAEDNISSAQIEQLVYSLGGSIIGHINYVEIYQVLFSGFTLNALEEVVTILNQSSHVRSASLNTVETLQSDPNEAKKPDDPWNEGGEAHEWDVYPWEDGLIDNRVPRGNNWAMESMRLPEAWLQAYPDGSGNPINVGIVDSDFPVFIDEYNNVTAQRHIDLNFTWVNRDGEKDDTPDKNYQHGHLVAGIIGATQNNGIGVTGAVWNANLICYKTTYAQSDLFYAIAHLIFDKKVEVINFSIGELYNKSKCEAAGSCQSAIEKDQSSLEEFRESVDNKVKLFTTFFERIQRTGVDFLFVQAAGNSNIDAIYTGWAASVTDDDVRENLLVVGAYNVSFSDHTYKDYVTYSKWKDSNFGKQVDIYAPGGKFELEDSTIDGIYSTVYDYDVPFEVLTGSKYRIKPGTSMAAPHVTGLAAMIKQTYHNLSWAQVKKEIVDGRYAGYDQKHYNGKIYDVKTKSFEEDTYYGLKVVDAKHAMVLAQEFSQHLQDNPDEPIFPNEVMVVGNYNLVDSTYNSIPVLEHYDLIINARKKGQNAQGDGDMSLDVQILSFDTATGQVAFDVSVPLSASETAADVHFTFSLHPKSQMDVCEYNDVTIEVSVSPPGQAISDDLVFEPKDTDGDGIYDDGDNSGISGDNPCTGGETVDCDDNCPETYNPDQTDSDGDGVGDVCDMDNDNDGIPDDVEDANHNGVVDPGETNPYNIDTDGDGIQDGTELGYTLDDIGAGTDTSIFQPDLDPTTITDPLNEDTDGDGLLDGEEDVNQNGRLDLGETDPVSIWEKTIVDAAGPSVEIKGISIALDRNNNPAISYSKYEKEIKLARFDGNVWVTETVKTFDRGNQVTALAFDSNNFPRIVSDNYPKDHSYSEWDGFAWQTQTFFCLPTQCDLQIDDSDFSHIVWYRSGSLEYRIWNGSTWQVKDVDWWGDLGYGARLMLDEQGHKYISYAEWGHKLKFAYYNGIYWSTEYVDDSIGGANSPHPIALDNQNNPVILYVDEDKSVKLASKIDGQWQFQTTPLTYPIGHCVGFIIDEFNQIHISCRQEESGTHYLKYVFFDGINWSSQVVDQFADLTVGYVYSDLALSDDGTIHIAYNAFMNYDLKHASR